MLYKIEERTNLGPILIGLFLLNDNLCHGNNVDQLHHSFNIVSDNQNNKLLVLTLQMIPVVR